MTNDGDNSKEKPNSEIQIEKKLKALIDYLNTLHTTPEVKKTIEKILRGF